MSCKPIAMSVNLISISLAKKPIPILKPINKIGDADLKNEKNFFISYYYLKNESTNSNLLKT